MAGGARNAPLFEWGSRPSLLVLAFGLCTLPATFGQEPAKPLIPPAGRFRISVASRIAQRCGGSVSPAVIQQDAEAGLRSAGFTVSSIYSGRLAIEVDCGAVAPGAERAGMLVQQCADFSELVTAPSNNGKAMLATTWRKCQSFECRGARCEPLMRSRLSTLTNAFVSDFQERNPRNALLIPQIVGQPEANAAAEKTGQQGYPGQGPPAAAYRTVPVTFRQVFYSLYLLSCLCVLLYWRLRKTPY